MIRFALAFLFAVVAYGQIPESEEFGYLGFEEQRAAWPEPESVVRALRSPVASDRLRAFGLMGLSQSDDEVDEADEVRLIYARLGGDKTTHAVVSLQVRQTYLVAVVLAPKDGAWERLARFTCWCKYDLEDPLGSFVEVQYGPVTNRLVMRGSGGGTGLYEQEESHFIVHQGSVREVISFVSRMRSCSIAPMRPCEIERRWFDGRTLVEARGRFPSLEVPRVIDTFPDAELRYAGKMTCRPYRWDAAAVQYVPEGAAGECR